MTLLKAIEFGLEAVVVAALLVASLSDVRTRRIPNWTAALVAVCTIAISLLVGDTWAFTALFAALAGGYLLYAIKWVGAGDAKLFAAVAPLAGWQNFSLLVTVTVIAGGCLAAAMLVTRPKEAFAMLRFRPHTSVEVPYGLAIAFGGFALIWLRMLG